MGCVACICEAVFLERSYCLSVESLRHGGVIFTGDREAAIELLRTLQLIDSIGAEFALAAHTGHPFDANSITLFPQFFHIIGYCHDHASSFVPRYSHGAILHRGTGSCVVIVVERSVGSTDASVINFAENLAGSRVGDCDCCDFTFGGLARAFPDASFLVCWEVHGCEGGKLGRVDCCWKPWLFDSKEGPKKAAKEGSRRTVLSTILNSCCHVADVLDDPRG